MKRLLDRWGPTRRLKLRLHRARRYARHRIEGEEQLLADYERRHGRRFDPDAPERFTEKVVAWQVRLHRAGDRRFARFTDKVTVRDFVRERLGADYLPGLYWVGEDPAAIPFDDLPSRYVIKPNHRSGDVFLGAEGLDRDQCVRDLTDLMGESFYWCNREYQYLHITPRVLVEERVDDGSDGPPLDYSVWCFHGEPRLLQVRRHPMRVNQFYDLDWNLLELKARREVPEVDLPRPSVLPELVEAGARLARGFEYVRVDFYLPPGRILFGEMTLSPSAGRMYFHPEGWDARLGRMWRWPDGKAGPA